jgi:hypothetical protein
MGYTDRVHYLYIITSYGFHVYKTIFNLQVYIELDSL